MIMSSAATDERRNKRSRSRQITSGSGHGAGSGSVKVGVGDDIDDGFSKLPDDIIVDIISRLSLREAVRTCILSSRWKYLWTLSTNLNFAPPRTVWKPSIKRKRNDIHYHGRCHREQMSKYISWVNKILQMHQSSNIKVFRINCGSGDSHNETIVTNWIYTAIAKGVEKLVLDLEGIGAKKHYGFPQECLSSIKYCSNLKSLSLVRVEVSREIVEYFIYNCGFLEALCVKYSAELSGNLKIVGNSQQQQQLKLKYLEFHCCSIEGVEINSVPSLLSFKFFGLEIMLNIENVPQLLDISVGGHKSVRLSKLVEPIMPFLPQLESLTLHLHLDQEEVPFPSCELPELRHLTFQVVGTDCKDLSELTTFMKACPYLQKLTIKLVYVGDKTRRRIRKYRNNKCCHEHLKEVEFVGFVGRPIDLELASHLLETATNLQKIIANPTCIYSVGSYYEFEDDARKRAARKRAKWIEQNLPPGVEFILL